MQTLYHYTDLNAFLSIIQQRKLWLTGVFNLNDSQEIYWALNKIKERLHDVRNKCGDNNARDLWEMIENNSTEAYICSLSSDGDRLSQWRAYGQNGTGIAIGFKEKSLPQFARRPYLVMPIEESISLQKIIYSDSEQEEMITQVLKPLLDRGKSAKLTDPVLMVAAIELSALTSIFKNHAFHEECEWRIVHRPLEFEKRDNESADVILSISPPKHRVSGGKLVTYYEYSFDNIEYKDIFLEIILGPKCEASERDLSIFLMQHGLESIKIKKSSASNR